MRTASISLNKKAIELKIKLRQLHGRECYEKR